MEFQKEPEHGERTYEGISEKSSTKISQVEIPGGVSENSNLSTYFYTWRDGRISICTDPWKKSFDIFPKKNPCKYF